MTCIECKETPVAADNKHYCPECAEEAYLQIERNGWF